MNYEHERQLEVYNKKINSIFNKKAKQEYCFEYIRVFPLITKNKIIMRKIKEGIIHQENKVLDRRISEIKKSASFVALSLPKL